MTRPALVLAFALLSTAAFAQAKATIGIDEALVIVRANGIAIVSKLEHEHEKGQSIWEGEGLDANGKKVEIVIDAMDGKIISKK